MVTEERLATNEAERGEAGVALRLARFVGRNLPLVVGGLLFAHLAWYGLQPALIEQERLEEDAAEVFERHAELQREAADLERRRAALEDPFFRERLRRVADARARAERPSIDAGDSTGPNDLAAPNERAAPNDLAAEGSESASPATTPLTTAPKQQPHGGERRRTSLVR